jgi:hypothetical protein
LASPIAGNSEGSSAITRAALVSASRSASFSRSPATLAISAPAEPACVANVVSSIAPVRAFTARAAPRDDRPATPPLTGVSVTSQPTSTRGAPTTSASAAPAIACAAVTRSRATRRKTSAPVPCSG